MFADLLCQQVVQQRGLGCSHAFEILRFEVAQQARHELSEFHFLRL